MDILERLRDADKRGVAPPQNWTTEAADEIERLREVLRPLAECHLPPIGYEQHGVTAHFTTEQIISAKATMRPNALNSGDERAQLSKFPLE